VEETAARAWDRARSGYRRFSEATDSWAERWMPPILAALCVLVALASLPSGVAALRNDGTPGVFTAVRKECNGRAVSICLWQGAFSSDDGTVMGPDVSYDGPGVHRPGDRARALAVDSHPGDVYAPGDPTVLWLTPLGAISLVYLIWWSRRRWRNARLGLNSTAKG
jgi:hypothetical protein